MPNWLIQESTLTDIADAIRAKKDTSEPIAVTDLADEIANMNVENLYAKHLPIEMDTFDAISNTIMDIFVDNTNIVTVNSHSYQSLGIIDKAAKTSTILVPVPTGADATDLPQDMSKFYNNGNGITCRSITATDTHYVIGLRYSAGTTADGVHLYGGIVFVNKLTKTVDKSYWLPYLVSRVVYDKETNLLAVGLQKAGLKFYTVNGYTLTEAETFLYDWSQSQYNGRESQAGCFYTDTITNKRMYANCGFGTGIRFYDVSDSTNITYINELYFRNTFLNNSHAHTYTSVVKFPYLYATIARDVELTTSDPEHDGVLTVDISDLSNIKVLDFTHVPTEDAEVWDEFGDSKPTEMKCSQNMLYLNYEKGYLAFEIDAQGKKTHYCGKYLSDKRIYGIGEESNSKFYIPTDENGVTTIKQFESDIEWNITKTLSYVTLDNNIDKIAHNNPFVANVTVDTGYEINSVQITMGGVDITSTAYANNVINIDHVTGDLNISIIAAKPIVVYWKPSDGVLNQYQTSKPATITQNNEDIDLVITQGNSGFKTIVPLAESPTANITLKLKADAVTVNEPSTHTLMFQTSFKDAGGTTLKIKGFFDTTSTLYAEDIVNGITTTFNYSDIAGATQYQVTCRTANSSDTSLFPMEVAFTNLRIEVVE